MTFFLPTRVTTTNNSRRSKRSEDNRAAYANTFLCCDFVNRLRDDINCLCQDTKRLAKMKIDLEASQKKFDAVYTELRQKLSSFSSLKGRKSDVNQSEMKISETRDFMKYAWSLANSGLDKRAKKGRFTSVRGVIAADYLDELFFMTDLIQKTYCNEFQHVECSALYTHLTRQLQYLLAPELLKGDTIEFSSNYMSLAMPAMVHVNAIADHYLNAPRMLDFNDLCNELFYRGLRLSCKRCRTPAIRTLATYLRGHDPVPSTAPVVEGRASNFYQMAAELAHYIIETSCSKVEPVLWAPLSVQSLGLLDAKFQNKLWAPKNVQQAPLATTGILAPRGRGRPRKRAADQMDRQTAYELNSTTNRRVLNNTC